MSLKPPTGRRAYAAWLASQPVEDRVRLAFGYSTEEDEDTVPPLRELTPYREHGIGKKILHNLCCVEGCERPRGTARKGQTALCFAHKKQRERGQPLRPVLERPLKVRCCGTCQRKMKKYVTGLCYRCYARKRYGKGEKFWKQKG